MENKISFKNNNTDFIWTFKEPDYHIKQEIQLNSTPRYNPTPSQYLIPTHYQWITTGNAPSIKFFNHSYKPFTTIGMEYNIQKELSNSRLDEISIEMTEIMKMLEKLT